MSYENLIAFARDKKNLTALQGAALDLYMELEELALRLFQKPEPTDPIEREEWLAAKVLLVWWMHQLTDG